MENLKVDHTTERVVDMSYVSGSKANETTVALYNSCRPIEVDEKGKFIWLAIKPIENGCIIVAKAYK